MDGLPVIDLGGRVPRNGEWITDPDDAKLAVRFYRNARSGKDHVEIKIPGDDKLVIDEIANDHYRRRFARQWHIYANELDAFAGQTRIETVAFLDEGTVADLKRLDVHTVEQLSGVSDNIIEQVKMPGFREIREKAKVFLEDQRKLAGFDELQQQIDVLKAQLADNANKGRQQQGRRAQG